MGKLSRMAVAGEIRYENLQTLIEKVEVMEETLSKLEGVWTGIIDALTQRLTHLENKVVHANCDHDWFCGKCGMGQPK